MTYHDRIYGTAEITEPVVLALTATPSFERLKGIDQAGYSRSFFPERALSTRFEHSVGVFLLLRKFGAPLEEQIAGLLHDVSHTVFSHTIDYVLPEGSEVDHHYQDNTFEHYVRQSEIPAILSANGFSFERLFDDQNFPLKEQPLPELCADRIDYALRDGVQTGMISLETAHDFLDHLRVRNGQWIFQDFEHAKNFAYFFSVMNAKHYASIVAGTMFRTLGDYVKYSLEKQYILPIDLMTTDDEVLKKIAAHHASDPELMKLFTRLENNVKVVNDSNHYDATVFVKSRAIDPLWDDKGTVRYVSDTDTDWKKRLKEERQPKIYYLRFLDHD